MLINLEVKKKQIKKIKKIIYMNRFIKKDYICSPKNQEDINYFKLKLL